MDAALLVSHLVLSPCHLELTERNWVQGAEPLSIRKIPNELHLTTQVEPIHISPWSSIEK